MVLKGKTAQSFVLRWGAFIVIVGLIVIAVGYGMISLNGL
jgi:hypothetical protein